MPFKQSLGLIRYHNGRVFARYARGICLTTFTFKAMAHVNHVV